MNKKNLVIINSFNSSWTGNVFLVIDKICMEITNPNKR